VHRFWEALIPEVTPFTNTTVSGNRAFDSSKPIAQKLDFTAYRRLHHAVTKTLASDYSKTEEYNIAKDDWCHDLHRASGSESSAHRLGLTKDGLALALHELGELCGCPIDSF
jgi:hypothetical protein